MEMPPSQQNEKETKLSSFIDQFVGVDTYAPGLVHYVDSFGMLHEMQASNIPQKNHPNDIRIVAISDTHQRHELLSLPPGDVLLHCGDILMFNSGFRPQVSVSKLRSFNQWLGTTPYTERVCIGGNHDSILEVIGKQQVQQLLTHCHYLENEQIQLQCGLSLFGTPASQANSTFSPNKAFQYNPKFVESMFKNDVSPAVDVLITHGPLHSLPPAQSFLIQNKTPYYFCGHVHEEHGVELFHDTIAINASTMANKNKRFSPSNPPIVTDFPYQRRVGAPPTSNL